MNLADVFTFTFIIIGTLMVFIGYWLMAAGLFPGMVARCSDQIGKAPIKTTLLGAVGLIPLVVIGLVISTKAPNGAVKILGLMIALLAILLALFGSAGLAQRIGEGLKSTRDEAEPWRRTLRGGIVLALTFVMPFLGTFVVLPLALLLGFGSVVITRPRRQKLPATEQITIPPTVSAAS